MRRDPEGTSTKDRLRIQHMLDACDHVILFVSNRSRADLESDIMLVRALMNAIQEIGEAASRVTEAGRTRAPGVPWREIVAMRHILVHVYWGVDLDRLWQTAIEDVPTLREALTEAVSGWPLDQP